MYFIVKLKNSECNSAVLAGQWESLHRQSGSAGGFCLIKSVFGLHCCGTNWLHSSVSQVLTQFDLTGPDGIPFFILTRLKCVFFYNLWWLLLLHYIFKSYIFNLSQTRSGRLKGDTAADCAWSQRLQTWDLRKSQPESRTPLIDIAREQSLWLCFLLVPLQDLLFRHLLFCHEHWLVGSVPVAKSWLG